MSKFRFVQAPTNTVTVARVSPFNKNEDTPEDEDSLEDVRIPPSKQNVEETEENEVKFYFVLSIFQIQLLFIRLINVWFVFFSHLIIQSLDFIYCIFIHVFILFIQSVYVFISIFFLSFIHLFIMSGFKCQCGVIHSIQLIGFKNKNNLLNTPTVNL